VKPFSKEKNSHRSCHLFSFLMPGLNDSRDRSHPKEQTCSPWSNSEEGYDTQQSQHEVDLVETLISWSILSSGRVA